MKVELILLLNQKWIKHQYKMFIIYLKNLKNGKFLRKKHIYQIPTENPSGLIRQMQAFSETHLDILFPVSDNISKLDSREVHQLIRELVVGVYALNSHPLLSLEAN